MIAAIVVGLIIIFLIALSGYIGGVRSDDTDWDRGILFGVIAAISVIIGKPKPTPMEVYQGKPTLEHTIRNSIKIDSVVVWKGDIDND